MAYTLKLGPNGQYILDTQDLFATTYAPRIGTAEFEAYTGQKTTTTPTSQGLAGQTTLAQQTEKVMRETPGQYQTVTDPVTGETKTISKGQAITEIKDTISTLPTPTTGTGPKETSLDKVQKILAATPAQTGGISGSDYLKQIEAIQKSAQKAQLVNTLVKGGLDIGVNYLKQSMGGFQTGGYTGPMTQLMGGSYGAGGGYVPVGYEGFGAGGEFATGGAGSGFAGPGLAAAGTFLQTGDVGKAVGAGAGAYAGQAIGTAIGGPIGGAIGATIGGAIGGGGSVICTELNRQGLISKEDLKLNWNSMISKYTKDEIKGYWIWAMPMAEKMKTNKTLTKFWHHVMSHRIKDVKWKLGQGKFTLKGRIYSILMENISLVISKFIPKNKKVFI